ncbi:hypothetical protein B0H11DRAFT_2245700 [Mycena galericulata]|nr:hypothetical protein B0H11DRAFT_2245700 [Mycena galericulata]
MSLITIATGAAIDAENNVVQRDSVHMQPPRVIPSVALDSMLANLSPQSRPILSRGRFGLQNDADTDAGADPAEWDAPDSYLLLEENEEYAAAMNPLYKSTVATKKGAADATGRWQTSYLAITGKNRGVSSNTLRTLKVYSWCTLRTTESMHFLLNSSPAEPAQMVFARHAFPIEGQITQALNTQIVVPE